MRTSWRPTRRDIVVALLSSLMTAIILLLFIGVPLWWSATVQRQRALEAHMQAEMALQEALMQRDRAEQQQRAAEAEGQGKEQPQEK